MQSVNRPNHIWQNALPANIRKCVFHEISCDGMISFLDFMRGACQGKSKGPGLQGVINQNYQTENVGRTGVIGSPGKERRLCKTGSWARKHCNHIQQKQTEAGIMLLVVHKMCWRFLVKIT